MKYKIAVVEPISAIDLLSQNTPISKSRLKLAMTNGAVWLQIAGRKTERLRMATKILPKNSLLTLYYDEDILTRKIIYPELHIDESSYSVWNKPPGLLTQGTFYGDHLSLLRQVSLYFEKKRPVYPVHRLDREVGGLIVVAHKREIAAKFSELFRSYAVEKQYSAIVAGVLPNRQGEIDIPIDGKKALTKYEMVATNGSDSLLNVYLHTGRKHQIRIHFSNIGYPIVGDPRYGGAKNVQGIMLTATCLAFMCPLTKKYTTYKLENGEKIYHEYLNCIK